MAGKKVASDKVGDVRLSDPGHVPPMSCFILQREEDVSGTSGTGAVAQGVVFSDGRVVLRWLTIVSSMGLYDSIADLEKIHGHGGKTKVIWL